MAGNGRKWQKIDFRVFHVVAIEVEKGGQVKMVENGRKWSKIDFRGYLVGNGFPRILRHSPTTDNSIYRFVGDNSRSTEQFVSNLNA